MQEILLTLAKNIEEKRAHDADVNLQRAIKSRLLSGDDIKKYEAQIADIKKEKRWRHDFYEPDTSYLYDFGLMAEGNRRLGGPLAR